jgi:hypothetical protein
MRYPKGVMKHSGAAARACDRSKIRKPPEAMVGVGERWCFMASPCQNGKIVC